MRQLDTWATFDSYSSCLHPRVLQHVLSWPQTESQKRKKLKGTMWECPEERIRCQEHSQLLFFLSVFILQF